MNTIDAAAYIQNKLTNMLKKFPAGSVSRREVVSTIPFDDPQLDAERYAAEVDRRVTATIYKAAADMWDQMPEKISNFNAFNPYKMDPSKEEQLAYQTALTLAVQGSVAQIPTDFCQLPAVNRP